MAITVSGSVNIWDPEPFFFLSHLEQETFIVEVTCSHKMAVAALAIASSSPGRKKERWGKDSRDLPPYLTLPFHSIQSFPFPHLSLFFLTEEQIVTIASNYLFLTNGSGCKMGFRSVCKPMVLELRKGKQLPGTVSS